jgi:hypothetical protein
MRPRPELIGLLLAAGLATGACAAPGPAMPCRHPLTTIGSADALPRSIIAQVHPWMALHGERWDNTDAVSPGELTAGFLWAGRWNADWIVAFRSGGIACCSNRFGLFTPTTPGAASYRQILPEVGAPDLFGDVSCKGVDAALDAYAGRR